MSKKIFTFLFVATVLSLQNNSFAVVKGSEGAVSVEPTFTFPAADSDNKMLGFGWFKNGFSLEDSVTTCTFDSVYPVSGNIDLQGGTLYLKQDLIVKNTATLLSLGTIVGDNHLIDFCSSVNEFPDSRAVFQDTEILLNADLLLTDSVTFRGNCTVRGQGYDIFLGDTGTLIIDSNATVRFSHVVIDDIKSGNIILADDTSEIVLENVIWKQHGDYVFDTGKIKILNHVDFIGSYSFVYDSSQTSTISGHSIWSITHGMIFKVGRREAENAIEPLYFEDGTSILMLDSCSFIVTASGMCLTRGKIEVDRDVDLEIVGTTTSTGLVVGNCTQEDDFIIHLNSGASLKFKTGQLTYNNYGDSGVSALSESARIIRYAPSSMYIARDWVFPSMVLKVHSGVPATWLKEGVVFTYEKSKLIFNDVEYDFSGHQSGSYHFFLNGDDYLYLTKGTFITPLNVNGSGNKIYGAGNFGSYIILQDSNTDFICNLNGIILGDVILNGGKVTLAGDLRLGSNAVFAGAGTVDLSEYNFDLSGLDSTWTGTVSWQSNGGAITMNSNVHLSGRWEFDDSCVISGNGHNLDVGETGSIVIKDGVQLILRDISLHTVSQNDIQLLSDTSSIILDNVIWNQDTNILFDTGSIQFLNAVDFKGSYSFFYDSSRTSTIAANSTWKISGDMVLRIGRKNAENYVEPLYFQEDTSILKLSNCSFVVTGSGMCLSRGKVFIDKDVNLEVVGTTTTTGLVLGTGEESDDVSIVANSGAAVHFRSGQLMYNNCCPEGIAALSEGARFIRYGPSKTYVASNWLFPNMILKVASGLPETVLADGVTLCYDNTHLVFGNVEFDYLGSQHGASSFYLSGNEYLHMSKGAFLLPISVYGSGNLLGGSGSVAGFVILHGSDAELTLQLNGNITNLIIMNGGKISLAEDISFTKGVLLNGSGRLDLGGNKLTLGHEDLVWPDDVAWDGGDYGSIDIRSKIDLIGTWTFGGTTFINGHGNTIDLSNGGDIIVDKGSQLILRDLKMMGVSGNNIRCLDDDSSIIFENVVWNQDDIFTFTVGSFQVKDCLTMKGDTSFVYQTKMTSTVLQKASWKFDPGFTFVYDPTVVLSKNLIEFEDGTSSLTLHSASLHANSTGMAMKKGNLVIKGECYFSSDSQEVDEDTIITEGITLGGSSVSDDCTCKISVGSALTIVEGALVYNNLLEASLIMGNQLSSLKFSSGTKLVVNQNINFPEGVLYLSDDAFVSIAEGKQITGSVFIIE